MKLANGVSLLLVGCWLNDFPDAGCQSTAYQRAYDEHSKIGQSLTALEQGWANAAGRVDRSAREVDADQMNQNQ